MQLAHLPTKNHFRQLITLVLQLHLPQPGMFIPLLTHGQAVGIGLLFALDLSVACTGLQSSLRQALEEPYCQIAGRLGTAPSLIDILKDTREFSSSKVKEPQDGRPKNL